MSVYGLGSGNCPEMCVSYSWVLAVLFVCLFLEASRQYCTVLYCTVLYCRQCWKFVYNLIRLSQECLVSRGSWPPWSRDPLSSTSQCLSSSSRQSELTWRNPRYGGERQEDGFNFTLSRLEYWFNFTLSTRQEDWFNFTLSRQEYWFNFTLTTWQGYWFNLLWTPDKSTGLISLCPPDKSTGLILLCPPDAVLLTSTSKVD